MELLREKSSLSFLGGVNLVGKSFLPRRTLTELTCLKWIFWLAGRRSSPLFSLDGGVSINLHGAFNSGVRVLLLGIFLLGGLVISGGVNH